MRAFALLLALLAPSAQDTTTLTVAPCDKDRHYVLAEWTAPGAGPYRLREGGKPVPCQIEVEGGKTVVRWLVADIPANAKKVYVLEKGEPEKTAGLEVKPSGDVIAVRSADREITRYYTVAGTANKKPCFYPLVGQGVNVLRGHPLEDRPNEAKDHPHHTGIFHAFGDVNGKDYWSKTAITNKSSKADAGPVYARVRAENAWGEDLVEKQDVVILNAGADVVMDWTITLTAANGPVVFGHDQKMAKEGSFALRVGAELSRAKGDAPEMMLDSLGNKGEKAIRAQAAPWVDYVGDFGGKQVGVSVMNHPASYRYPGTWHVRAYGLFAANPWYVAEAKSLERKGEDTLAKGASLTLKYRIYVHAGDAAAGKVAATFEGYSNAKLE